MPDQDADEARPRVTRSDEGEEPGEGNRALSMQQQGNEPEGTPERNEAYQAKLAFYLGQLDDENESVRWKAAESLGRLRDPAAVQPLIDTLWDDDARVRMKAAWALGEIGNPHALPALQRLYRMENENVWEIVERAMTAIKQQMMTG